MSLAFGGIPGDLHFGATRRSGGREPWYPRGTEIRNERQLSIVAPAELAVVAERMGLAEIRPEWIGANLLLDGIPHLSMLPPGTQLFFKGGATLKIDSQNGPCGIAGRQVAIRAGMADQAARSLLFAEGGKTAARPGCLGREARNADDRRGMSRFACRNNGFTRRARATNQVNEIAIHSWLTRFGAPQYQRPGILIIDGLLRGDAW